MEVVGFEHGLVADVQRHDMAKDQTNPPNRISCMNLHSKERGLSAIRGGATRSLGSV